MITSDKQILFIILIEIIATKEWILDKKIGVTERALSKIKARGEHIYEHIQGYVP